MDDVKMLVDSSKVGLGEGDLRGFRDQVLEDVPEEIKRILLVPPDITRLHSWAGEVTCEFYSALVKAGKHVRILPALGTHEKMTEKEIEKMYPSVPHDHFLHHNWRDSIVKIGEIPAHWMEENSDGWVKESLDIEINENLMGNWDLIVSIGQVVPHEVAGMANYSKNIVIGCGGKKVIDHSHMLSAIYGIEKTLGEVNNPVRSLLDYVQEKYLSNLPLMYVLTVTSQNKGKTILDGLFSGSSRLVFEKACQLSSQKNIFEVDGKLKRVVVWLDPEKFKSTWLGNKAIYRTRLALDDSADLIVLAPGVTKFGEDKNNDSLIRKYGYVGSSAVLSLVKSEPELKENLSVAAHLIHGSSESRFNITYAVDKISKDEIEQVGYRYQNYSDIENLYPVNSLEEGFTRDSDGENIYFISNPALGLWKT